jgi:hypothetical protein
MYIPVAMCMQVKAALLVMNLGVQREEKDRCVSTARASSETGEQHSAGIRQPLRADMYTAIGGNVVLSCKGQRYRAKEIVAETSKLMQCECALYEGECERKQGPSAYTRRKHLQGTWRMPRSLHPYCVIA